MPDSVSNQTSSPSLSIASLEDIPDRNSFLADLNQRCLNSRNSQQPLALIVMDIADFRRMNTFYGHSVCDNVLLEVCNRLQSILRDADSFYRLGSDEFAVIMTELRMEQQVELAAQRFAQILEKPFKQLRKNCRIRLHQGAAIAPRQADSADTLLRYAESALLHSRKHRYGYFLYDARYINDNADHALLTELEQALKDGDLELYFQPKIHLSSGQVISAEVLTRWTHTKHGPISPARFIPLLEGSDLIVPFTQWTLNGALHFLDQLNRQGLHLNLAVNLSPRVLTDPSAYDLILRTLRTWNPKPDQLTLEVTEGSLMEDPENYIRILNDLRMQGIKISIDDFGTGYSSLAYLKQLPASELKIDKAFVFDLARSPGDKRIVQSVIDLGHNFGMDVVAEGVEDNATLHLLASMGCDHAQGMYIAEPLPGEDFLNRIESKPE